jgi:ApaG protein
MRHGSEACTRGVRVEVESFYVPERSSPENDQWFFGYRIRITNEGDERVQLVSRHWTITDASGNVEQVRGPGVVGEQPSLDPGDGFEYTSACPLPTSFGTMHGSYRMVTAAGEEFDAEIAPFPLGEPNSIN